MKVAPLSLSSANSTSSKKTPSFKASLVCTPKAFENILTSLSSSHSTYSRLHSAEETEKMFGKEPFSAVKTYREFRKTFEEQTREALSGYRFILTPSSSIDCLLGLKLQTPDKKTLNFYNSLINPVNIFRPINKAKTLNGTMYEILLTGAALLKRNGKRWDGNNPCIALIKKLVNTDQLTYPPVI